MKQKTMKKLIVRLTIAKVVFGLLEFILTIVFIVCIMNNMNSLVSSQRAEFDEKERQSITAAKNTYSEIIASRDTSDSSADEESSDPSLAEEKREENKKTALDAIQNVW